MIISHQLNSKIILDARVLTIVDNNFSSSCDSLSFLVRDSENTQFIVKLLYKQNSLTPDEQEYIDQLFDVTDSHLLSFDQYGEYTASYRPTNERIESHYIYFLKKYQSLPLKEYLTNVVWKCSAITRFAYILRIFTDLV